MQLILYFSPGVVGTVGVVGTAVVGTAVVGTAVVGTAVVGTAVVGTAVVGTAVVGTVGVVGGVVGPGTQHLLSFPGHFPPDPPGLTIGAGQDFLTAHVPPSDVHLDISGVTTK